jgi:hypothetical protein
MINKANILNNLSKATPVNIISKDTGCTFRAVYVGGRWFAKATNGKIYPIDMPEDIVNRSPYIYSTPKNDYYPQCVPKKHIKLNQTNYRNTGMWAVFKPDMVFKGKVVDDIVIVNWDKHAEIIKAEYDKIYTRRIKR